MTADEIMHPAQSLATVAPEESLLKALEEMDNANVAQLPVVNDGNWLGMLDRERVVHYMRARAELGV